MLCAGDEAFPPAAGISARADMLASALRRSTEFRGQRATRGVPAGVAQDLPSETEEPPRTRDGWNAYMKSVENLNQTSGAGLRDRELCGRGVAN